MIDRPAFSVADGLWRNAVRNAAPEDLQYLTEENIDELGAAMTHVSAALLTDTTTASSALLLLQVEKMRLQAALQALRDE